MQANQSHSHKAEGFVTQFNFETFRYYSLFSNRSFSALISEVNIFNCNDT